MSHGRAEARGDRHHKNGVHDKCTDFGIRLAEHNQICVLKGCMATVVKTYSSPNVNRTALVSLTDDEYRISE